MTLLPFKTAKALIEDYKNTGTMNCTTENYDNFLSLLEKVSKKNIPPLEKKFTQEIYLTDSGVKTRYEDEYNKEFLKEIFNGIIPSYMDTEESIDVIELLNDIIDDVEFYYFNIQSIPSTIHTPYFTCLFKYNNLVCYIAYNRIQFFYLNINDVISNISRIGELIDKYKIKTLKNNIHMVLRSNCYYLENFKIESTQEDIFDNYNEDFLPIHETIIQGLQNTNKGIVLLHGIKGSGKTTYIRHLINSIDSKPFIFIPSFLHNNLTSTDFITFLTQSCKNSILVIEDGENLLRSREAGNSTGAISDLLNMADGLMSDVLNIQFICTFNTAKTNIDSALTRPGRLIAEYCFGELTEDRVENLCKKLNKPVSKSRLVAEIYNETPPTVKTESKKIGF